jgi:serine/threonine protein kinase
MRGSLTDRYTLGPQLGAGATGEVVQAYDRRNNHSVAIKRLHAELTADPPACRRCSTKRSAASGLSAATTPSRSLRPTETSPFIRWASCNRACTLP